MQARLGALPGSYENGETYAEVLAINHFGSETIPPRPVLRMAAERLAAKFVKERLKAYMTNVVRNPKDAKRLEAVFLQSIGAQTIAEAKRLIEAHEVEQRKHNAPATIAKKGFDKPLYVEGELEKHLSYEITE